MTDTIAAPRPEMLPRVEVLAEAYAPLVDRWGSVFDVIERAEPEELPVDLLDAVAEMETECEAVRAEALARLEDVRCAGHKSGSEPIAFWVTTCEHCGSRERYANGNCRPCHLRARHIECVQRRQEKARARLRKVREKHPMAEGAACLRCGTVGRYASGHCVECLRQAARARFKGGGEAKPGAPRKTHCARCGTAYSRTSDGRAKCLPCRSRKEHERYLRRKAERAAKIESA